MTLIVPGGAKRYKNIMIVNTLMDFILATLITRDFICSMFTQKWEWFWFSVSNTKSWNAGSGMGEKMASKELSKAANYTTFLIYSGNNCSCHASSRVIGDGGRRAASSHAPTLPFYFPHPRCCLKCERLSSQTWGTLETGVPRTMLDICCSGEFNLQSASWLEG